MSDHYIREWRKYRGLTQEQLAQRIELSGVALSRIESGRQPYSQGHLHRIAEALGCSPGDLITRNPEEPDSLTELWAKMSPVEKSQALAVLKAIKGEQQ